jgi:hypothetical protein
MDVVYTNYSIYCVDLLTGAIKWEVPSGFDMRNKTGRRPVGFSNADVIVMDIDGCGYPEIITGHNMLRDRSGNVLPTAQRRGFLAVYDRNGNFKWFKELSRPVNSVAVADFDGNGRFSVIAGLSGEARFSSSTGQGVNIDAVHVFNHDGSVRPGWPQLSNANYAGNSANRRDNPATASYIYGLQNNTIGVGVIDGSGRPSVIVPTDLQHLPAFDRSGRPIRASSVFDGVRPWGRIGTWLDYDFEKRVVNEGFSFHNERWSREANSMVALPWDQIPIEERLWVNFSNSRAVIADVDGDGRNEIVLVGRVHDAADPPPAQPVMNALFIFNGDRSRFKKGDYDWETVPTDAGPVLLHDWQEIIAPQLMPVVDDVNNDGTNEIIFNTAAGKVMCYSLDKKFAWSHWINNRDNYTIEYAAPPVTYDLNKNGFKDIIFATNTPYKNDKTGRLIILDYKGDVLQRVTLPAAIPSGPSDTVTNGVLARPVVTEVGGRIYIVLNTHKNGLTVYRMP